MAFDFINQAIDKVVGAGKAVKDVATTAVKATKDVATTAVDDWKAGADSIKKSITAPAKAKVDASVVQEIKNGGKLDNSLINALVDKAINLTIPKGVVNDVVTGSLHQPSAQEVKQKVDAGIPITEAIHQLKVTEPLANYVGKTISPVTTKATDLGLINQGQANQILSNAQGTAQFLGGNIANLAPLESGVRKGVSEVKDVFNRENDTRSLKGKATDLLVGLSRPIVGGLQSYMSVTPTGIGATTAIGGVNKLTGFDKYQEKVIDNTAKKMAEKTGASYEDAKNRVEGMIGALSTASGFKTAGAIGKIGSKQVAAESIIRDELKSSGTKATQKEITDLAKNIQDAVTPAQQLKSNIKEGLKATSWATAPQIANDILAAATGTDGGDIVNQAKLHTAAGLSNVVGAKTGGGKKSKTPAIDEAQTKIAIDEPTPKVEVPQDVTIPKEAVEPTPATYNLKTKKSAYNFITNQKRFDEKGIVYKASTSDGKEVYGNLDIHNKKMVLRIPNSNEVYSVTSINKIDSTPIKISEIPVQKEVITTTPETSKVEPTPATPDVNQTLISLVDTYKGDGKTKGKIGSIQVDFGSELDKALYSVRESKNKLKPKDESALQELARLSGLDEASIRKLGEDVATKIKDKIYREKAVTPEGVKLADTNVPKEDDILGINEPTPTPKEKVVSPLTQRYQELIANNAKEGDALSRAKGIFDFTPTGKIGNFFQKTFDKIGANLDRIASTKTFLNNFRVGEGKELAGNYVESKQARDYSQLNSANIDEFNIADRVKESAITPKRELKESDLVGATTPEGFVLDDKFAKEAYDTYRLDGEKVVERANPLIAKGVSSKDIKQSIESTYIYDVFKNNPEKLNEFFTPEQVAILQKQYADNAAIQSEMAKSGQDIGVIPDYIDPESGYLRKVTTARAAKQAGKLKGTDDGKIEVTLSDGTVMRVDTMEDALRLSALKRDSNDLNPENMSSLTKKQAGPEYDPFRVHGSTASLLSLNDAMSKLYADKNAIKFIDGLIEKGDPNYTGAMKTKAYNLMAKDILGIRGTAGQTNLDKTIRGVGRVGVTGTMLVNPKNAGINVLPSYARTLFRSIMDFASVVEQRTKKEGIKGFTGAFKDANFSQIKKSMFDERVDARLRGLGAINEFNIDNASPVSQLEGKLMYVSNGTWAEIPGSKLAAVLSMSNSLNRAGRLEGAKDANDVIDRWEAWQKEGGQDFYEARGALDDQLRSLGKTDSSDKLNIPYVPASVNAALGALKSWGVGQAGSKKEAITTIARNAYEKVTGKERSYTDRQAEEATKDMAARALVFYGTAKVIKEGLIAAGYLDEDDDEDLVRNVVRSATTSVVPDPLTPYLWSVYDATTSGSAAVTTPVNIAKGAIQLAIAGGKEIFGNEKEAQAWLRDGLANLGKVGSIKAISDITGTFNKGDSLQDIIAKGAGTFSKEEANASGIASGKNWNSALDRFFKGTLVNVEQAKNDALYSIQKGLDAPDWVNKVPYGNVIFNAIKQEMRPIADYFNDQESNKSTPGDILDKSIRAGYAYDVVKDLHNSKDSAEFFQKNGLEGKDEMVQELMKNLITSNISQNKNVDERYEQLVQGISSQTFLQDMEKLRGLDPYIYNNVVATLGELKEIKDQAGSLSPEVLNRRVIDRIKNKTNSISQEDYAIAQANDDYALTTSFTNAIGKDITKINKDLDDSKPQEAKEKMDNLEKLSAVMNSPSIYAYKIPFANLIANNATDIKKAFTILGADPNSYPFLKNAMLFGAKVVRGAADTGQSAPPAPVSNTPAPSPLSGTTLSSMVRKPVIIDKPATVSNITIDKPLKVGQLKIDPTLVKLPTSQQGASLSNQTLSSMVKRKTPKL